MANTIRDAMTVERIIGRHKFKASLGQAWGVGSTEKRAKDACEASVLSIISNERDTKMEIRDGYLIVSRITDADQGWYLIKRLSNLTKNEFMHPQTFMRASALQSGIDSHLAQYKADDTGIKQPRFVPADTTVRYTGAPMTPGFAVFNCHCNDAKPRAKELFIACFGEDQWLRQIQPYWDSGFMSIFNEKPNKYTQWYVDTVTAIVNEHAVEKSNEAAT